MQTPPAVHPSTNAPIHSVVRTKGALMLCTLASFLVCANIRYLHSTMIAATNEQPYLRNQAVETGKIPDASPLIDMPTRKVPPTPSSPTDDDDDDDDDDTTADTTPESASSDTAKATHPEKSSHDTDNASPSERESSQDSPQDDQPAPQQQHEIIRFEQHHSYDPEEPSIPDDFFFNDFKLAWGKQPHETDAGFIGQDAFSASWWQTTQNFLRYDKVELKTSSPEGASFEVIGINEANMRVTRDWMDLNIEHMSKWWKVVLSKNHNPDSGENCLHRILEIFKDYTYSSDRKTMWDALDSRSSGKWLEVSQSTIAVIAFMPYEPGITKWSLAATLMSLVQLGVGRIVVSGSQPNEDGWKHVQEAWTEVQRATQDWKTSPSKQMTTINFCNCGDAMPDGQGDGENIPKTSLRRLRHVLLHKIDDPEIRTCWGGPTDDNENKTGDVMDRWKYVFLGEPDLILNLRPSALGIVGRALREGGVLAPHRLQPMPHDSDFGIHERWTEVVDFLVPNVGPLLNAVVEIDHYHEGNGAALPSKDAVLSSCCDDGNQKPFQEHETCGTWWWQCGFSYFHQNENELNSNTTTAVALEAHKRAALYPFVRLKRGTGVVFLGAEQGRRCLPSTHTCPAGKAALPER